MEYSNIVSSKPSRHLQPWSNQEKQNLLIELQSKDVYEIANIHQRTTGSISAYIDKLIYEMYSNGVDINNIVNKVKRDEKYVNIVIDKFKNKFSHKSNNTENNLSSIDNLTIELKELNKNIRLLIEKMN